MRSSDVTLNEVKGLMYLKRRDSLLRSVREFLVRAGKLAVGAAAIGMDPLAHAIAAPPRTHSPISDAIESLGYGTNAKMMVGFNSRPWVSLGSNGEAYSDLANHQLTWETNPLMANASRGVLTDYSSGQRGATLNPNNPQHEANRFLSDLDNVFPGALAAATRDARGGCRVHLEHWQSNPLSLGSYTCYRPGQFTSIAGNEGTPVGNLYFAGEHANSFYEWQGFMEGAALSGIQAANEILQDIKEGQLG